MLRTSNVDGLISCLALTSSAAAGGRLQRVLLEAVAVLLLLQLIHGVGLTTASAAHVIPAQ
jgi:hypothetical protein